MKHYGISPWEINVITSILDKRFKTEDEEIENTYDDKFVSHLEICLLYTSPSPRDLSTSRMPSSA